MRIDVNGDPISAGDRVIIVKDSEVYGTNPLRTFFLEKKVYGNVSCDKDMEWYCCGEAQALVNFSETAKMLGEKVKFIHVDSRDIRKLKPEEYKEYEDSSKEAIEWAVEYLNGLKHLLDLPAPTKNYTERTFNFEDRKVLCTNKNYVTTGKWYEDRFSPEEKYYGHDCCAFTQDRVDLDVYIPDVWLSYFGWTPYDIGEWLEFLTKCDIGFEYEYSGLGDIHKTFAGLYSNAKYAPILHGDFSVGDYASEVFPQKKEGFHRVKIRGSKEFGMLTYLRFICVRYLYNHEYWTIPGHAMQIKRALGGLVSHWEALLMAHLYRDYYSYYCLVSNVSLRSDRPYKVDKAHAFSSHQNFDKHVYPFQKQVDVFDRIVGYSMNSSFECVCDAFKREELRKFFDVKDYIGLYNYVRERIAGEKSWRLLREKK